MAVEEELERELFFDCDEFAVEATYTRSGQTVAEPPLFGIFDDEHFAVGLDSDIDVSSVKPLFQCATEKLPTGYGAGDTLVINSTTFRAADFQPEGTGLMVIVLEKTS